MTGAGNSDLGPVRPLDVADLPACLDLAAGRGWPREDVKFRFHLAAGSGFGVDDPGGGLAASVAVTRYEPGLAVIGLLLVAARHGRRGLGRLLTEYALAWAGGRVVYLYATPEGRPLYEALGFRVLDHVVRHAGTFTAGPAGAGAGWPGAGWPGAGCPGAGCPGAGWPGCPGAPGCPAPAAADGGPGGGPCGSGGVPLEHAPRAPTASVAAATAIPARLTFTRVMGPPHLG
jgi:GNAT superfamily N-acetyltransferase